MSEEVLRTYAYQYGTIFKYLKQNSEDINGTLDLLESKMVAQIPQIEDQKVKSVYTRTLAVVRNARTILRSFDLNQILDMLPQVEEDFPGLYERRTSDQKKMVAIMERVLFGPPLPRGRIKFDIPKLF
jgi:hypothetical protein